MMVELNWEKTKGDSMLKKLALILTFALISALPAMACGGKDKDDEKDGLKPMEEMTKIYCGGNKDKDDEKDG